MRHGTIIGAVDHGTIWQLAYWTEGDTVGVVNFDHRPFASFYEGATGSNFFEDYNFGRGREYIANQLKGLRVVIEGDSFCETVRVED